MFTLNIPYTSIKVLLILVAVAFIAAAGATIAIALTRFRQSKDWGD
ncbi:hypothetical protein [Glutamicibacter sp.]